MVAMAWFKLVDYEVGWDKLPLLGIRDVVDMKEAIKARMAPTLDDFPIAGITISVHFGAGAQNLGPSPLLRVNLASAMRISGVCKAINICRIAKDSEYSPSGAR